MANRLDKILRLINTRRNRELFTISQHLPKYNMNEFSTAEPGLQQFATTSAQDHFLQLTSSLRNGNVSANAFAKTKWSVSLI